MPMDILTEAQSKLEAFTHYGWMVRALVRCATEYSTGGSHDQWFSALYFPENVEQLKEVVGAGVFEHTLRNWRSDSTGTQTLLASGVSVESIYNDWVPQDEGDYYPVGDGTYLQWPCPYWSGAIRRVRSDTRLWMSLKSGAREAVSYFGRHIPEGASKGEQWAFQSMRALVEFDKNGPCEWSCVMGPVAGHKAGDCLLSDSFKAQWLRSEEAASVSRQIEAVQLDMEAACTVLEHTQKEVGADSESADDHEGSAGLKAGAGKPPVWLAASEVAMLLNLKTQTVSTAARKGEIRGLQSSGANSNWTIDAESAAEKWKAEAGPLRVRIAEERKLGL